MNKYILFALTLLFTTHQVHADRSSPGGLPPNIIGTGYNPQAQTPAATTPTAPATTGTSATHEGSGSRPSSGGGGPSINPAAQQGQKSQGSGAGANLAAGASLIASAIPLLSAPEPSSKAMGAALIAMGLLGLAQGGHDAGAAGQSGQSYQASLDGVGNNGLGYDTATTGSNGIPTDPQGAAKFIALQTKKANDALAGSGYSVEADGLHNPDGSVTPKSAFSSPSAMASAGLDSATVKAAEKILAGIDQGPGYKVSSIGVSDGGGGGGSHSGSSNNDDGPSYKYKNPFALSSDAKKQIVAGKTVLFDGEPIGVRGQNIFDMIHTCYQKKRTRQDFIEIEPASVPVRSPASIGKPAAKKLTK